MWTFQALAKTCLFLRRTSSAHLTHSIPAPVSRTYQLTVECHGHTHTGAEQFSPLNCSRCSKSPEVCMIRLVRSFPSFVAVCIRSTARVLIPSAGRHLFKLLIRNGHRFLANLGLGVDEATIQSSHSNPAIPMPPLSARAAMFPHAVCSSIRLTSSGGDRVCHHRSPVLGLRSRPCWLLPHERSP